MITYLISITVFLAVAFIIYGFFSEEKKPKLNLVLEEESDMLKSENKQVSPLGIIAMVNWPFTKLIDRELLKHNLSIAKLPISPEQFFLIKELSTVVVPTVAYVLFNNISLPLLILTVMIGFVLPDIWLRGKVRIYKETIVKLLPDAVDLLSLCVSSGLDFMLAIKWVVEKSDPSVLKDELTIVLQEIQMGMPRKDALNEMAKRLQIPDVSSFVRTVIQTERMGTSVAEALKILSEEARLQRFRRGERMALQAPIKMLIPLIFCILPVVFIIVAAPVFLQFTQSGIKF